MTAPAKARQNHGNSGPWNIDHVLAAVKKTNRFSNRVIRTTHTSPASLNRMCLLGELTGRLTGCTARPGGSYTASDGERFARARKVSKIFSPGGCDNRRGPSIRKFTRLGEVAEAFFHTEFIVEETVGIVKTTGAVSGTDSVGRRRRRRVRMLAHSRV